VARRLTRPELRDRHVLVIDDNAQARQVLADMLQSMTFDVHEAPSGPEGLELVRQAAVRGEEENGLFLGKFDFATYSSVELPLLVGEFGLLYTDGIAETNNPDEVEFGAERFRPFLASQKEVAVKQFADALLAEVATWSARPEGADLDDDITMVAFQVR